MSGADGAKLFRQRICGFRNAESSDIGGRAFQRVYCAKGRFRILISYSGQEMSVVFVLGEPGRDISGRIASFPMKSVSAVCASMPPL